MEKLQLALEKARKQRDAEATHQRPTASVTRPKTPDDVTTAWEALKALDMPPDEKMDARRIVALRSGPASSAFDMLRTRIHNIMHDKGWRRMVITSPTLGCGKTTLSANLLTSFGRQTDLRTILLELDMRRPALGKLLGSKPPSGPGIEGVLTRQAAFAEEAKRLGRNAAVCVATGPAKHSSELLQGHQTQEILTEIETTYDPSIVILDMPPILAADDTVGFLTQADCALIVAEAGRSTASEIDSTERLLAERTEVLGVVLNKSRHQDTGYEGTYGY
jgi:protein-tyrosine kinase